MYIMDFLKNLQHVGSFFKVDFNEVIERFTQMFYC